MELAFVTWNSILKGSYSTLLNHFIPEVHLLILLVKVSCTKICRNFVFNFPPSLWPLCCVFQTTLNIKFSYVLLQNNRWNGACGQASDWSQGRSINLSFNEKHHLTFTMHRGKKLEILVCYCYLCIIVKKVIKRSKETRKSGNSLTGKQQNVNVTCFFSL